MTPDLTVDLIDDTSPKASTAGMTAKVVKGSIWTLAGQVAPLFATILSTPFVIRLLGSEAYGVLLLVGLIPNYFSFADFGMGMASTKFGSEAFGRGDTLREGQIVRTAAMIALACSCAVALPLLLLAGTITAALNVPEVLQGEAAMALRLTSLSFVVSILSGVLNTPQLSRLRMDLNATVNAAGRILLAFGTVLVLYLGGGIVGAALFGLCVAAAGLVAHISISGSLLSDLFAMSGDRKLIRPLITFGGGLLISGIAGILLVNLEKLLLTRLTSIESLAYYSVAFTFANMATMFSWAMVQSLIPAFSQLLSPEKKGEFDALFSRSIRLGVAFLLPTVTILFVVAKPFFTLWAGEEFGRESPLPFYILLVGLLFNIVAYVPYASLVASGNTILIAKAHWAELLPYAVLATVLIYQFGIAGAAAAWSLRVAFDALLFIHLAKRTIGAAFDLGGKLRNIFLSSVVLLVPVLSIVFLSGAPAVTIAVAGCCVSIYIGLVFWSGVAAEEKLWLKGQMHRFLAI